jgi:Putative Ig domain
MRTLGSFLQIVIATTLVLSLAACLTDEKVNSESNVALRITGPTSASKIQTPDIVISISGTATSNAEIQTVSWKNDRGGKGNANGTNNWATGNIVLQVGTNVITITAQDENGDSTSNVLTVERENTTAPGASSSNTDPVLMYSYNSNLSAAAPADRASILPKQVYLFVVPGSDWDSRGVAKMRIRCCKGQAGPGWGEDYFPTVVVPGAPWSSLFNMSGFAAGGTRRVRFSAEFGNGVRTDDQVITFTVAQSTSDGNIAPVISGKPEATATVGIQYNFRPTASDANGDTMLFSVKNKPSWALFESTTGRLHGTPTSNQVGSYDSIEISVSDGSITSRLPAFSITVEAFGDRTATLRWAAPTERTDNTVLTGLAGFNLYYGQTTGDYGNKIAINNAGVATYVVENLSPGKWYFVITAIDNGGIESNPSNEVTRSL